MATKRKLGKTQSVLAATTYRTVDEVLDELAPIAETILDGVQLLNLNKKQIASLCQTANIFQIVDNTRTPGVKNSPEPKVQTVKIKAIKELRKNYAVTQSLFAAIQALDTVEANLRQSMTSLPKADKALQEVSNLRAKANKALGEAFRFLTSIAQAHQPSVFTKFVDGVISAIEKSISYDDARLYQYVHEVDGDIVFSDYLQLQNLLSEDGKSVHSLLVVLSYKTGRDPGFYVNTLKTFEPPSDSLLVKRVKDVKDALHAINLLLELDGFANSLNSIPLRLLMKDKIDRNLFSDYKKYISDVEVEDTLLRFMFKSGVSNKELKEIIPQLYLDVKGAFRNTKARLRIDTRKMGNKWVVEFFFVKRAGTVVQDDDLEFLRSRFGLGQDSINLILKIVNE